MQADLTDVVVAGTQAASRAPGVWRLHVVASPDPALFGAILSMTAEGRLTDGTQIGRLPDAPASLQIDDWTLSRRHATISRAQDGLLRVTDLSSSNGTFVAGQRIQETLIGHGGVLRLGANVFVLEWDTGQRLDCAEPTPDVPGRSERARQLRGALRDAAQDTAPTLLLGEAGTGREHAAHELHVLSGRQGKLVRLRAAIPQPLLEVELFGRVAGPLGARTGRVQEARDGTLVLDEIADLSLDLQDKLLHVLEKRVVRALGAGEDVPIDVHVCASSSVDLAARTHEGRFRPALLEHLSAHAVTLPSLRDRRMDLFALASALMPLRDEADAPLAWPNALHEEAVEALLLYDWPDNLRELAATLAHLHQHIGPEPVPRSVLSPTILRGAGVMAPSESTARLGGKGKANAGADDAAAREPVKPAADPRDAG